jgi:outer membrane protein TolC
MRRVFLLAGAALVLSSRAWPRELDVKGTVLAAEDFSPSIKAALQHEIHAKDDVAVAQAEYYPFLDVQAIDAYGQPDTKGALGVGGLVGASGHSGPLEGLTSHWNLLNFGTFASVALAKSEAQAAKANTAVVRFRVDAAVLVDYFLAARDRADQDAWHDIGAKVADVAKKVHGFVIAGQVLQAQEWLVDYQAMDARSNEDVYIQRYHAAMTRLADMTGLDAGSLTCPSVAQIPESEANVFEAAGPSSLVAAAQAQAKTFHAAVDVRDAENYPALSSMSSVSDLNDGAGVTNDNLSVTLGLVFPLFKGFAITNEIRAAEAAAAQADLDVSSANLDWQVADVHFGEEIAVARVQVAYLADELKLVQKAFDLALGRFLKFQEPLIDVQESLRALAGIESDYNEASGKLLLSIALKAAYDGGVARP